MFALKRFRANISGKIRKYRKNIRIIKEFDVLFYLFKFVISRYNEFVIK